MDGADLPTIYGRIFELYCCCNLLHSDLFPFSAQLESELIRMVVNMYHGDANACGVVTSGGTESILLAMKAYRDRGVDRGITEPNICVPISGHAAFWKAGQYFKIKVKKIALDPKTGEVCLKSMKRAINSSTVAIVGSCPNFPHGTVDPILKLARLAKGKDIGLHVDACLGGFLIPFMNEAGFTLPPVDFRVT